MIMRINPILGTITKSMAVKNAKEREFEGIATIEMVDKDDEITVRDNIYKQFPIWMKRGAPINDVHTNRVVGKGLGYSKVKVKDPKSGKMLSAIKMRGKIYSDHEVDDRVWKAIQKKEYKGLSFGGANRSKREPVRMKGGKVAYRLEDVELYEISVCKSPTANLALITDFSKLAKGMDENQIQKANVFDDKDGNTMMRCTDAMCYVMSKGKPDDDLQKELNTRLDVNNALTKKEELVIEEEEEEKTKTTPKDTEADSVEKAMNAMATYVKSQNAINEIIFEKLQKMAKGDKMDDEDEDEDKMGHGKKKKKEKAKESAVDKAIREFEEEVAKTKKEDDEDEEDKDDEDEDEDKGSKKTKSKNKSYTDSERPDATEGDGAASIGNEMLAKARELGAGNLGKLVAKGKEMESRYR